MSGEHTLSDELAAVRGAHTGDRLEPPTFFGALDAAAYRRHGTEHAGEWARKPPTGWAESSLPRHTLVSTRTSLFSVSIVNRTIARV